MACMPFVSQVCLLSDRAEELGESSRAFEREYVDDRSWEDLQEDEHGRLQALVRLHRTCGSHHRICY